jgi:DNA-binding NarL/FixJ family response regulator
MNTAPPLRCTLGLIDDHPTFLMGLEQLLSRSPQLMVRWTAEGLLEGRAKLAKEPVELLILDLSLGGESAMPLVRERGAEAPPLKTLVLSAYDERHYGEQALRAGATGYLSKHTPPDQLVAQVLRAAQGRLAASDALKEFLLERQLTPQSAERRAETDPIRVHLSAREIEVFELLGRGQKASEIASKLCVSVKTVDTHLHNMKRKLGVEHVVGLIRRAAVWVSEQQGEP